MTRSEKVRWRNTIVKFDPFMVYLTLETQFNLSVRLRQKYQITNMDRKCHITPKVTKSQKVSDNLCELYHLMTQRS